MAAAMTSPTAALPGVPGVRRLHESSQRWVRSTRGPRASSSSEHVALPRARPSSLRGELRLRRPPVFAGLPPVRPRRPSWSHGCERGRRPVTCRAAPGVARRALLRREGACESTPASRRVPRARHRRRAPGLRRGGPQRRRGSGLRRERLARRRDRERIRRAGPLGRGALAPDPGRGRAGSPVGIGPPAAPRPPRRPRRGGRRAHPQAAQPAHLLVRAERLGQDLCAGRAARAHPAQHEAAHGGLRPQQRLREARRDERRCGPGVRCGHWRIETSWCCGRATSGLPCTCSSRR